jgi:ComF family protein
VLDALFELIVPSVCPACDRPRPAGATLLCVGCRTGLLGLHELGGAATALAYTGTAATLLRRFKFDGRRDALRALMGPLAARAAELPPGAIVPVPRHAARIRELGADPVRTLARALARRSGRAFLGGALHRTRAAPPQTGLAHAARRANVRGSFQARPAAVYGRSLLLLDDVTTTGATLEEARRALARAGARVSALALAGTPPPAL